MAGKNFTLDDFRKNALNKEQITSLKGGYVDYPHERVASDMIRISWEGLDIRVNVPGQEPERQASELTRKFITLR